MKLMLKQVREAKGWSRNKLSKLSGVSQGYISELEDNKKNPSVKVLCDIAKALGCTLDDLVDCEG